MKCTVCLPGHSLSTSGECVVSSCLAGEASWRDGTCSPCTESAASCDVCVTGFDNTGTERAGCS